tara:strand:- start:191 stop:496 length:306 start_codon:yes stop_codon:yes gene_type:complete
MENTNQQQTSHHAKTAVLLGQTLLRSKPYAVSAAKAPIKPKTINQSAKTTAKQINYYAQLIVLLDLTVMTMRPPALYVQPVNTKMQTVRHLAETTVTLAHT